MKKNTWLILGAVAILVFLFKDKLLAATGNTGGVSGSWSVTTANRALSTALPSPVAVAMPAPGFIGAPTANA